MGYTSFLGWGEVVRDVSLSNKESKVTTPCTTKKTT